MSAPWSLLEDLVKDSSLWCDPSNTQLADSKNSTIRLAVVVSAHNDVKTGELRYIVQVQAKSKRFFLPCRMMRRFSGIYNYEDHVHRGYAISSKPDQVNDYAAKAGDVVLVALLNGNGREGIILGGLMHTARKTNIKASDGPQYDAEFNGMHTNINSNGEWTFTFKGQPTNLNILNNAPSKTLPAPIYDTNIGSSYMKFDKTGSWTVDDNSKSGIQTIILDKPNGVLKILSGKISLKMTKQSELVELNCKVTKTKAADLFDVKTKEFTITSSTRAYIKTPKVAIGTEAIELLDQLAKLIDKLGTVQPISPVGACTTLGSSPGWSEVEAVKAKIKQITGSF